MINFLQISPTNPTPIVTVNVPPKFSFLDPNKTPDRVEEPRVQKFPKVMMSGPKSDQTNLNFGDKAERGISVDPKLSKLPFIFKPELQPQMCLRGV